MFGTANVKLHAVSISADLSRPGEAHSHAEQVDPAMDDAPSEIAQLDDFQVIAERRDVAQALAALTDRYRQLSQEMNQRETLRWMLP